MKNSNYSMLALLTLLKDFVTWHVAKFLRFRLTSHVITFGQALRDGVHRTVRKELEKKLSKTE